VKLFEELNISFVLVNNMILCENPMERDSAMEMICIDLNFMRIDLRI